MKKILIILFLIPLLAFTQSDTTFNSKGSIISIDEEGITNLLHKYKTILRDKGGVDGWRLQIKFTSKREDILPYQVKFTNLYPEIPAQITFDSPYYKLTVGNFKTKNEALKVKHKISKNFPGAHPISIIIDQALLER
ncbi:MAG: hypothetical protein CMD19_04880 [Flavobacteriales bacterium]|nr:hypothetical protein [Flavobacteriales bacterium]|tara:strand:+ start:12397 stop:12807 length:411 start_codon:yes stop_codon:yes gene_type:complete